MIKGETKSTYTVSVGDVSTSLYCVVTDTNNKKFYSKETSRIQRAKVEDLTIKGYSGFATEDAKTATIAVVGDTLTAVTDPETSATLVSYQWYREGSKITGATTKSYTLTGDDIGSRISVKIEAIDEDSVSIEKATAEASSRVMNNVNSLTMKLSKTENIQVDDAITALVKLGDADADSKVNFQWYRDSVDDKNAIASATNKTYTVTDADNGHTLVCLVTGDIDELYYGKFELKTGNAQKSIVAPTIKHDATEAGTGFSSLGVGTKLIAKFEDTDTTATYQWYKSNAPISGANSATYELTANDVSTSLVTYKVVVNGTGAYTGTSQAEQAVGTVTSKVAINEFEILGDDGKVVTGDDLYIGKTYTAMTYPAKANDSIVYTWHYKTADGTQTKTGSSFKVPTDALVCDGHTGIIVTALYIGDDSDNILPGANAIYTSNATKTITVNNVSTSDGDLTASMAATISAFSTTANDTNNIYYYINKHEGTGTANASAAFYGKDVKKGLTSTTITYDNNAYGNKNATGYKTYNAPEVGIYAHATIDPTVSVDYQWYVDKVDANNTIVASGASGQHIANGIAVTTNGGAQTANLKITDTLIGHKLICVATGTGNYEGAKQASEASAAVVASSRTIKSIKIVNNTAVSSITDKTTYDAAAQVTSMTAGSTYNVVILTSDDEVITDGSNFDIKWDGTKSVDYIDLDEEWPAVAGKGIITVTVKPDGKNYTGDKKSYTFNTEVSGGNTTSSDTLQITPTGAGVNTILAAGATNGSANFRAVSTACQGLTTATTGISEVASFKWYKMADSTSAGIACTDSGTISGSTTQTFADTNGIGAGIYYCIVTDTNDVKHYSEKVQVVAPAATTLSGSGSDITTAVSTTIASFAASATETSAGDVTTAYVYDQFGRRMDSKTLTSGETNLKIFNASTGETQLTTGGLADTHRAVLTTSASGQLQLALNNTVTCTSTVTGYVHFLGKTITITFTQDS